MSHGGRSEGVKTNQALQRDEEPVDLLVVLGAVLDVGVVELRPEHIAAGGGGGEVAGEEQGEGGEDDCRGEARVSRPAGGGALRR